MIPLIFLLVGIAVVVVCVPIGVILAAYHLLELAGKVRHREAVL